MQNWGGPNPDPLLEAKYGGKTPRDYDLSFGIALIVLVAFIAGVAVVLSLLLL